MKYQTIQHNTMQYNEMYLHFQDFRAMIIIIILPRRSPNWMILYNCDDITTFRGIQALMIIQNLRGKNVTRKQGEGREGQYRTKPFFSHWPVQFVHSISWSNIKEFTTSLRNNEYELTKFSFFIHENVCTSWPIKHRSIGYIKF